MCSNQADLYCFPSWQTCTCVPAGMPDGIRVSIFVRHLHVCAWLLACVLVFTSFFVFIFTCLTATSGLQLESSRLRPVLNLYPTFSHQHKAGCPPHVSHSLTLLVWPLRSEYSCLPHKWRTYLLIYFYMHCLVSTNANFFYNDQWKVLVWKHRNKALE